MTIQLESSFHLFLHPSALSFILAFPFRAFPFQKRNSGFDSLRNFVAAYSCAGSGGFAPPSLIRRSLVSRSPARFVHRGNTWRSRYGMSIH